MSPNIGSILENVPLFDRILFRLNNKKNETSFWSFVRTKLHLYLIRIEIFTVKLEPIDISIVNN